MWETVKSTNVSQSVFSFISVLPHEQDNKMLRSLCVAKDGVRKMYVCVSFLKIAHTMYIHNLIKNLFDFALVRLKLPKK